MSEYLPAIEIEQGSKPQFAVIWLHGLGADGSDFVPVVPALGLAESPGVRFVFPHAPVMPVTCNGGWAMPAWYDILSLTPGERRIDEAGLLRSRAALRCLIEREGERGIPAARVFLAGFSQGGAVAYTTALTHPQALGGVIALSTYLPSPGLVEREATEANRGIPVFAAHGDDDDVVAPALGRQARDILLAAGYAVGWREYPMAHEVCFEEIAAIGDWLRERFAVA